MNDARTMNDLCQEKPTIDIHPHPTSESKNNPRHRVEFTDTEPDLHNGRLYVDSVPQHGRDTLALLISADFYSKTTALIRKTQQIRAAERKALIKKSKLQSISSRIEKSMAQHSEKRSQLMRMGRDLERVDDRISLLVHWDYCSRNELLEIDCQHVKMYEEHFQAQAIVNTQLDEAYVKAGLIEVEQQLDDRASEFSMPEDLLSCSSVDSNQLGSPAGMPRDHTENANAGQYSPQLRSQPPSQRPSHSPSESQWSSSYLRSGYRISLHEKRKALDVLERTRFDEYSQWRAIAMETGSEAIANDELQALEQHFIRERMRLTKHAIEAEANAMLVKRKAFKAGVDLRNSEQSSFFVDNIQDDPTNDEEVSRIVPVQRIQRWLHGLPSDRDHETGSKDRELQEIQDQDYIDGSAGGSPLSEDVQFWDSVSQCPEDSRLRKIRYWQARVATK